MTNWLILRVFAGLPLHVERAINGMGMPAYCPVETIKRRHPKGKEIITQHRPILPGYVFAPGVREKPEGPLCTPFEAEAINSTRTKVRWLQLGGRLCYLTQREIDALRVYEQSYRPDVSDIIHALKEIARGVRPTKNRFIRFSDFQTLAKQGQCVISAEGRAA